MNSNVKAAVAEQAIVLAATKRCAPRGHVRTTYSEHEVDLFAVYCGEIDRCFLLPAELLANRTVVYLRLTPARNGQRACINLAGDFTFDGAVAQLARAMRWQRIGQGFESPQLHSNPQDATVSIGADACRVSFGYWLGMVAAGEDVMVTRRGKPMVRLTAAAPTSQPLPVGAPTSQPLLPSVGPPVLATTVAPPYRAPATDAESA
jgi:antitoxin (DNA-binding transcriptional repressor) of toxin-antitoxin stability system